MMWRIDMASTARIFFAGVATTFVILAGGFGAGLMLAKSAVQEPPPRIGASSEAPSGMRVILPASAEPALQVTRVAPQPEAQPAKEVQASIKQVERVASKHKLNAEPDATQHEQGSRSNRKTAKSPELWHSAAMGRASLEIEFRCCKARRAAFVLPGGTQRTDCARYGNQVQNYHRTFRGTFRHQPG
jgi:hypothetical protein